MKQKILICDLSCTIRVTKNSTECLRLVQFTCKTLASLKVRLTCRNSLDQLGEFFHVSPALVVVESEVLNDFPRFVGILIAEFAAAGTVNLALKMKGVMIIKDLDLKPMIDDMMRDFL
uniref:Uncharacterized protein n=1 Tax=Tanacetum cinerariifolium TaxID=118510 RepID=A0A699J1P6_TANCI|nr:hypothetical protein [Tanacetum cinerariifolium]